MSEYESTLESESDAQEISEAKQNSDNKVSKKTLLWIFIGVLLAITIIVVIICVAKNSNAKTKAAKTEETSAKESKTSPSTMKKQRNIFAKKQYATVSEEFEAYLNDLHAEDAERAKVDEEERKRQKARFDAGKKIVTGAISGMAGVMNKELGEDIKKVMED